MAKQIRTPHRSVIGWALMRLADPVFFGHRPIFNRFSRVLRNYLVPNFCPHGRHSAPLSPQPHATFLSRRFSNHDRHAASRSCRLLRIQARRQLPRLMRLAADGVRFTQAFTHSPITNTSHITILTGLLPSVHGVTDFGIPLSPQHVTAAELLKNMDTKPLPSSEP